MAELVTSYHSAKIPEFAGYPVSKAKLQEYLSSVPFESIRLSFFAWSSDKSCDRKPHKRYKPNDHSVLYAYYWDEDWEVWIHPVRKTNLALIKDEIEANGLLRLHTWFLKQKQSNSFSWRKAKFEITFDGRSAKYFERE